MWPLLSKGGQRIQDCISQVLSANESQFVEVFHWCHIYFLFSYSQASCRKTSFSDTIYRVKQNTYRKTLVFVNKREMSPQPAEDNTVVASIQSSRTTHTVVWISHKCTSTPWLQDIWFILNVLVFCEHSFGFIDKFTSCVVYICTNATSQIVSHSTNTWKHQNIVNY